MQSSRERILQIIQSRHAETVGGLARSLDLAPATVRRHLDILQRDSLVTYTEIRRGTGRPEHSFTLTEVGHESFPKGYDALLGKVVRELDALSEGDTAGKTGAQVLNMTLVRIGERIAAPSAGKDRAGAIQSLVETLQDHDFAPEIEDSEDGIRITLMNCPFRSVAMTDSSICAYDTTLISTILGSQVTRERCISRGDKACVYVTDDLHAAAANRS